MPDANASASEYLDLNELANFSEPLPEDIESADYVAFKTMPVGNYLSASRKITGKRTKEGHITFTVVHEGGLVFADSGKTYARQYPLKKFISTKPYQLPETSGKTSGVAEYLRACDFDPKGMSLDTILAAMMESQTIAVGCFVGRTDRRVKNETTGEWAGGKLKTKDFRSGVDTDGKPVYGEFAEKDGKTYRATPTILSYSKLK